MSEADEMARRPGYKDDMHAVRQNPADNDGFPLRVENYEGALWNMTLGDAASLWASLGNVLGKVPAAAPPPDPENYVRARIALVVDEKGKYGAFGSGADDGNSDKDNVLCAENVYYDNHAYDRRVVNENRQTRQVWVEVWVKKPTVEAIEGEIVPLPSVAP